MPRYLTQEWLDEYRALATAQPAREGASAAIQYVITDGPEGDVSYYWNVADGRLVDAQLGVLPDPDFTWTAPYAVQSAIQQGALDANTAFMSGRAKVEGDMGRFMRMLPITGSPEFATLLAALSARTEY